MGLGRARAGWSGHGGVLTRIGCWGRKPWELRSSVKLIVPNPDPKAVPDSLQVPWLCEGVRPEFDVCHD